MTDSSVDVCMGTEADQKAFLTVVGQRLCAGSTRYSLVLHVTLLVKEPEFFIVVSCVWQRCSLSVSCEICSSNTL